MMDSTTVHLNENHPAVGPAVGSVLCHMVQINRPMTSLERHHFELTWAAGVLEGYGYPYSCSVDIILLSYNGCYGV